MKVKVIPANDAVAGTFFLIQTSPNSLMQSVPKNSQVDCKDLAANAEDFATLRIEGLNIRWPHSQWFTQLLNVNWSLIACTDSKMILINLQTVIARYTNLP